MTILRIPNDTPAATHAAIDTSQPGDDLVFDAGCYAFSTPLHVTNDRRYWMVGQRIMAADGFQGEYLIEVENLVEYCNISGCVLDTRGICIGVINFIGTHFRGLFSGNRCGYFKKLPPLEFSL